MTSEPAVGITEHDQILAEQPRADWGSIRLHGLLGQTYRDPVPAHELTHRRIAFDAAQQIVFLSRHHRDFLRRPQPGLKGSIILAI
jgi:hypothetical protein